MPKSRSTTVYKHPQDGGVDGHSQYILADGTRAGATAGTQSFTNAVAVNSTTNSTTTTTGSIQTDGGLGVVLNANIGGDTDIAGHMAIGNTATASANVVSKIQETLTTTALAPKLGSQIVLSVGGVGTALAHTAQEFSITCNTTGTQSGEIASGVFAPVAQGTITDITGGKSTTVMGSNSNVTNATAYKAGATLILGSVTNYVGYRSNNIVNFGYGATNPVTASGAWFEKQTLATGNNYGIVLAGDNAGADIVFGASQDDKIYHDSTNLVADCANAFHTTKGRIRNTKRVTTTYQILTTDDVVFCETASAYTVTLPTGAEGQTLKIINSGTGSFTLTVAPASGEDLIGITNNSFFLYDGESLDITYNTTEGWY